MVQGGNICTQFAYTGINFLWKIHFKEPNNFVCLWGMKRHEEQWRKVSL